MFLRKQLVKKGEKYGYLTTIDEPFYKRNKYANCSYILCRCDCGNKKICKCSNIKRGKCKSCGLKCKSRLKDKNNKPLLKEQWRVKIGDRFNKWTVIEQPFYKFINSINGSFRTQAVKCKCDCGTEKVKICSNLIRQPSISCGCFCKEINSKRLRKGTLANNGYKKCCKCLKTKSIKNFSKTKLNKDGFHGQCLECYRYDRFRKKYKLSADKYNIMLKEQNYQCDCCKIFFKKNSVNSYKKIKICIDHDHKSGKIRGLLCGKCNSAIGLFGDSINNLQNAINYLKRYNNDCYIER